MAGHGPAAVLGVDNASPAKAKLGLQLFFVYLVVYAGFVGINVVNQELMSKQICLGLNLAVVYGFGLIVLAIVMGLIYNHICTGYEDKMNKEEEKEESK